MADQQPTVDQQLTIGAVKPEPRLWTDDAGKTTGFIEVAFKEGSDGSVAVFLANPDELLAHREALKALIDKPVTFKVQAAKPYQNRPQWKIKDYPGKPRKPQQERGNYNARPEWAYITPEERAAGDRSIEAQVAMKGAVELAVRIFTEPGRSHEEGEVLAFVGKATEALAAAIRTAVGPLPTRSSAAPPVAPAPAAGGPVGGPVTVALKPGEDIHPASAPKAAAADAPIELGSPEWKELLDQAVELYGNKNKVLKKVRTDGLTVARVDQIPGDVLMRIIAGYEEA